MLKKSLILTVFFGIVFSTAVHAQIYPFRVYSVEDGLAQSNVSAIYQDSKGFLWLGTEEGGVSRFDGRQMQTFTVQDGISGNSILTITEDQKGNLLLGTYGGGVTWFDGLDFRVDTSNFLKDQTVYNIYSDTRGRLWFATFGNGLIVYDGTSYKKYGKEKGIDNEEILTIIEDDRGNIWVGTNGGGIFVVQDEGIKHYGEEQGLGTPYVFTSTKDSDGNLLFGTYGGGVYLFDGFKFQVFDPMKSIKKEIIWAIKCDKKGNIWAGTEDHGLYLYNGKELLQLTEKNGLSANTILSLNTDNTDNIWVGTSGGGVNSLNYFRFSHFNVSNGLLDENVTALCEGAQNTLWIGTSNGLNKMREGKISVELPQLKGKKIVALFEDKSGKLWIGTSYNGVYVYANAQLKQYKSKQLGFNYDDLMVSSIVGDDEGNIWIGSFSQGLVKYDGEKFEHFDAALGLCSKSVISIIKGADGTLWFSSNYHQNKGGVCTYRNGTFQAYQRQILQNKTVWSILEDPEKEAFWVGTSEYGLILFKGENSFSYSTKDGLISNNIYQLIKDDEGQLWVGTDKGLSRISFDEQGAISTIKSYAKKEGFIGVETNINTLYKDEQGNLWFGTKMGLTKYDAKKDQKNTIPPITHLTKIKLKYKDIDWSQWADSVDADFGLPYKLSLPYDQNNLTFSFVGIDMKIPEGVRYQFMLEGLNNEWSPIQVKSEAEFPSIPPGKYTFKVRAANADGVWNDDPATFSFTITPPFWQTTWFYVLLFVLVTGSMIAYVKARERNLIRERAILEEKVEQRTAELREASMSISLQKEEIEIKNKEIRESIEYAQKIQYAILPEKKVLYEELPNSFILYKPKDIVSGDFYWFTRSKDRILVAAADCTGHGVPGAFMSMIGSNILNQITNLTPMTKPDYILTDLHDQIRWSLKQNQQDSQSKDGMDIALVRIKPKERKVDYAGAYRPLFIVSDGKLEEIKGNRYSIGGYQKEKTRIFDNHVLQLKKGDTIYLFSDGYVDQFGGPKEKKFMSKRFKELLLEIDNLSMEERRRELDRALVEWMGDNEQVDDVLVIGIQV